MQRVCIVEWGITFSCEVPSEPLGLKKRKELFKIPKMFSFVSFLQLCICQLGKFLRHMFQDVTDGFPLNLGGNPWVDLISKLPTEMHWACSTPFDTWSVQQCKRFIVSTFMGRSGACTLLNIAKKCCCFESVWYSNNWGQMVCFHPLPNLVTPLLLHGHLISFFLLTLGRANWCFLVIFRRELPCFVPPFPPTRHPRSSV